MKFSPKSLYILFLFLCSSVGMFAYADTGTTYTGSLTTYIQTEKDAISTSFDTIYSGIVTKFSQTGIVITKSIEYQWLVCLWAMQNQSLLTQLQKDKTSFKIAFNKDFVELEKKVSDLEEKKHLQDENGIIMFDSGTTYQSEKEKLKKEIDNKSQLHRSLMTNFANTYTTQINEFITIFQSYLAANQQLLSGIKAKMIKVQNVQNEFAKISSGIQAINQKIIGLDDLLQKMETAKTQGIIALDKILQSYISTTLKKYKKIQNISDELTTQKLYMMGQYQMDIDQYVAKNLAQRYDNYAYITLQDDVEDFVETYYSDTNQLNCKNILSSSDTSAQLLSKIASFQTQINSWLVIAQKNNITSSFKNQIYSWFQALYIQKFTQRYTEYKTYLRWYINSQLRDLAALTPIQTPVETPIQPPQKVLFTKPFKSGQYSEDIKSLQNILTTVWLYSWVIDGVYNPATKNAVYKFQLSKWLLKGYEKKQSVRWYFGPATRNAINNITK